MVQRINQPRRHTKGVSSPASYERRVSQGAPTITGPQTAAPQASAVLDDSNRGLTLFLIFTVAVLIVTGAVVLVAQVGTWWMLGLAFAIHIVMTAIVVATILSVMDGRASTRVRRAQADGGRGDTRTPSRTKPARRCEPPPRPSHRPRPGGRSRLVGSEGP